MAKDVMHVVHVMHIVHNFFREKRFFLGLVGIPVHAYLTAVNLDQCFLMFYIETVLFWRICRRVDVVGKTKVTANFGNRTLNR